MYGYGTSDPFPIFVEAVCDEFDDVDIFEKRLERALGDHMIEARKEVGKSYYTGEGSPLARYRLAKGWSQRQLAELSGTSQSHIGRIETGANFNAETVERLASALEVDAATLAAELTQYRR